MKQDTQQKILTAASALFLDGGINALSVRAIAHGAGMSTIGIYSHFKGKQGIIDALYQEGFELLTKEIRAARGNTPAEKVIDACERMLTFSEKHTAHYRLIFSAKPKEFSPSAEAIEKADQAFSALAELSDALIKKAHSPAQKQEIALQIWALTQGYASFNQHEMCERIVWRNWKESALQAIRLHVYALAATR
ncbi:hypothetical protein D210916BOD24_01240 [Alteromonas sp. D210916BOD_24]|uniref:TetR/AcrR family transcriptional regulator n=1 Tax=Alteromonas sp. D210916BOD_24 TaxID=3157618 RepID=UPI00399CFC31